MKEGDRMKKCSLCGGKLDQQKRCTLCGLDNTKNDDQYKHLLNNNDCKHAPLTHVHEEPEREKAVKKATVAKQYSGNTYSSANYSAQKQTAKSVKKVTTKKKTSSKTGVGTIISVLVIILTMGSSLFSLFEDLGVGIWEEESYQEEVYYDPYEYVQHELSEDGEVYQGYLEPGIYTVGMHIPEGKYQVILSSGEYGDIEINDSKNSIFLYESLDYEGQEVIDDIRLYNGGYLIVGTGISVEIFSENAQPYSVEGVVNSLTESVVVMDEMIAGEDFPAGVYDICYEALEEYDYGSVQYAVTDAEGYTYEFYIHFDGVLEYETYHNVSLPEGAVITLEDLENITLIPSEIIPSENEEEFYERYW